MKRAPEALVDSSDGLFRRIERARVPLGVCRMSQRPVSAARRGASRHKVSPSFPYLLPSLRAPPRPSPLGPAALARPPSRAINERVIDARSVNRLLPFINSPGRRAAAAA